MTQSILDVRGIGPAMQIVLAKQGVKTIEDLASTTVELLALTPGISELKATQVINDARKLVASIIPDENVTSTTKKAKTKVKKSAEKSKKDKSKDKKNKKGKDKKKDKEKSKKSKKKSK